jgi:FMN-dependent oxidoreductase (nitrilotriacetate monooxygenase family)
MPKQSRQMHLGILVYGAGQHTGAWRLPEAQAGSENLELLARIARTAERGKFDFLFFADALNTGARFAPSLIVRLEPLTLLSALAMVTTHIGLAATASTTYTEPYNLARYFSSLDHISGGRAAWNIVTGALPETSANFSRDKHPPHGERYAIASEFVEVVKGLWDSWDDGAIIMDKESGVFADTSRMHPLNHIGKYFSVEGPLNLSRSPQGYPVLIQAGQSEEGRNLAAATGEVIFAVYQDMDEAAAFRMDIRARAARFGRNPDHIKVLPGVCPVVGSTEQEAQKKFVELSAFLDPVASMNILSERLGHDVSQYDLDVPLPELPDTGMMKGHAAAFTSAARRDNLTLRQLRNIAAASFGHRLLIGSPEQVADGLESWFEAGAVDGYNIMPPWVPGGLEIFVDEVVPILQRRGLFRMEYEGKTLRDHLGIPRPVPSRRAGSAARGELAASASSV